MLKLQLMVTRLLQEPDLANGRLRRVDDSQQIRNFMAELEQTY